MAGTDLARNEDTESNVRGSYAGLASLVVVLVVTAGVLSRLAGPPHLPATLPSPSSVQDAMAQPQIPLDGLLCIVSTALWLLWGWIALTLLLQLLVAAGHAATRGATWVISLQSAANRITPAFVQRAARPLIATTIVVQLASSSLLVHADGHAPRGQTVVMDTQQPRHGSGPDGLAERRTTSSSVREYTVKEGDSLGKIAREFYGTDLEWRRIYERNVGHVMSDGSRFTEAGVIRPGWVLEIPPLQPATEGDAPVYVVRSGDTLRAIAEQCLGDESLWPEIFRANVGKAGVAGHVLRDPDVIWPGLRLEITSTRQPQPAAENPSGHAGAQSHKASQLGEAPERKQRPSKPQHPGPEGATRTPVPVARPAAKSGSAAGPSGSTYRQTAEPQHAPAPTSEPGAKGDGAGQRGAWVTWRVWAGAGGLAALAAGMGASTAARRRAGRREGTRCHEDMPDGTELTAAEATRVFQHRARGGGEEPIAMLAARTAHYLREAGLPSPSVVTAQMRGRVLYLVVRPGSGAEVEPAEIERRLSTSMDAKGEASVNHDGELVLRLIRPRTTGLVPARSESRHQGLLIPLCCTHGRDVPLFVSWAEMGHLLVAGGSDGAAATVLTSVITSLAARCSPQDVRLLGLSPVGIFPSVLRELPHWTTEQVNAADTQAVQELLERLRSELMRRMEQESEEHDPWPELVLVIGELADLRDGGTALEMIAARGAEYAIRMLSATSRPEAVPDRYLEHYTTKMVLRVADEQQGARLIGAGDADSLEPNGNLYLRIGRRELVQGWGVRVPLEQLQALVESVRAAYGTRRPEEVNTPGPDKPKPPSDSGSSSLQNTASELQLLEVARAEPQPPGSKAEWEGETELLQEQTLADESSIAEDASRAELVEQSTSEVLVADNGHDDVLRAEMFGGYRVRYRGRDLQPEGKSRSCIKSWALLAYLCCQPSGRATRDMIASAIWPGSDPHEVGQALRSAASRLNGMILEQAPELGTRVSTITEAWDDGGRRINLDLVHSDVLRFMQLLEAEPDLPMEARRAACIEARKLYKGPLLLDTGYEWAVSQENGVSLRDSLERAYVRMMNGLGQIYEEEGDDGAAADVYRSLIELRPPLEVDDIEAAARKLYVCDGKLQDRRALIEDHKKLQEAVRAALYDPDDLESAEAAEPEPETIEAYRAVLESVEVPSGATSQAVAPGHHRDLHVPARDGEQTVTADA